MLIREIEIYLRKTGMSASRLGRDALGDPAFVYRLRNGSEARATTANKLREFMAS